MLPSLRKFKDSEVAQERLKIIQFYDEPGEAKTKIYFGANRKTVWTWKHKLVTARSARCVDSQLHAGNANGATT